MRRSVQLTEAELVLIIRAIGMCLEDSAHFDPDDPEEIERAERIQRKCREAIAREGGKP